MLKNEVATNEVDRIKGLLKPNVLSFLCKNIVSLPSVLKRVHVFPPYVCLDPPGLNVDLNALKVRAHM